MIGVNKFKIQFAAERISSIYIIPLRRKDRRKCFKICLAKASETLQTRQSRRHEFKNAEFDLELAVALAGCAFESYFEPEIDPSRKEVAVNRTETTYMDKDFLKKELKGVLEITNVKGINLPPSEEVYAQISLTRSSVWTVPIQADQETSNFYWPSQIHKNKQSNGILDGVRKANEIGTQDEEEEEEEEKPFSLFLHHVLNGREILKIRFFQVSRNPLRSDESRGTAMIPMIEGELLDGEPHKLTLSLQGEGSLEDSKVSFVLRYDPLEEGEESSLLGMLTKQKILDVIPYFVPEMLKKSFWEEERSIPDNFKEFFVSLADRFEEAYPEEQVMTLPEALRKMNIIGAEQEGWELGKERAQMKEEEEEGNLEGLDEETRKQLRLARQWKQMAREVGYFLGGLTPIAYIDNPDTDTQAWVYRNTGAKEMVVSFRGTEQVKWKDFATDANLFPVAFNPERIDSGGNVFEKVFKKITEPQVHQGFLNAYMSVRGQIFGMVDDVTQGEKGWTIFITGHSLGGALSTLCAYELTKRQSTAGQKVRMYSYGAPRVGNKKFADMYNSVVEDSWRIINTKDLVPQIPRLLGYCHVKQCVLVDKDKEEARVVVDPQDIFGEGKAYEEIFESFYYEVKEKDVSSVAKSILDHELQILNTLIDGSALAEHMENLYFLSLRSALLRTRLK